MASFCKPVKSVHDAAKPITRFEFVLAKSQKNFTVYRFKANYYQQRIFFALVFLQLTRDITSIYRQSAFPTYLTLHFNELLSKGCCILQQEQSHPFHPPDHKPLGGRGKATHFAWVLEEREGFLI